MLAHGLQVCDFRCCVHTFVLAAHCAMDGVPTAGRSVSTLSSVHGPDGGLRSMKVRDIKQSTTPGTRRRSISELRSLS